MDFGFDINAIFDDTITAVTSDYKLSRRNDGGRLLKELEHAVDAIGVKSAHAQRLSSPITSWVKLRINSHRIYILKDASGNNGRGCIIGFIKIGRKQLFVLDREGAHNEMHPLCVLDFYIHESQQRKGYGLKLYKHMLQAEGVEPAHLAIDRPSAKFTSFLRKHFNLWATLPQVNNFVVFDGFFKNRKDPKRANNRRGASQNERNDFRPLSRAVSDNVIKRTRQTNFGFNDSLNGLRPLSGSRLNTGDVTQYSNFSRAGQGARANMFSRFTTDEKATVPPVVTNRRGHVSRLEEEVVTNPYRRVTNNYSKTTESKRDIVSDLRERDKATLGDGGNLANNVADHNPRLRSGFENGDDRWKYDEAPLDDMEDHQFAKSENQAHLEESTLQAKDEAQDAVATVTNYDNFSAQKISTADRNYENFLANRHKTGGNLIPSAGNTKYNSPSDMVVELQQKDQKRNVQTPTHRYHNQPLFGSSWNIFGVASPASWKPYQHYQS